MILLSHPLSQYLSQKEAIDNAIHGVLEGGHYILGKEVECFEREFAEYLGVTDAIGVASGTEAIQLAIMACGLKPGDEVITVSHTAVATVVGIRLAGVIPVLVDIDPRTFTIDPEEVKKAITPKTKAILAVHLYGQAVDLQSLMEISQQHGLYLIEDCAQSTGATYQGKRLGSIGDVAAFSFYPTKNLGAIGDGGMVVSRHKDISTRVRLLRQYGWAERYTSHLEGINSRLDEIQAAVLRPKLKTLDAGNERREQLAEVYLRDLSDTDLVLPKFRNPGTSHVFHLFVIMTEQRDELKKYLHEKLIQSGIHYPVPIHLQPAYQGQIRCVGSLEHTEYAAKTVLSLPLYPELPHHSVAQVCEEVNRFLAPSQSKGIYFAQKSSPSVSVESTIKL